MMFFSSSFCLIKTFRRLRHISPRNLPFLKYKSWKEVLLVRFRVGLDDQEDVFYVVSSRGSQQFIFTKELTPSKMNTIPFITDKLWSKMILLNLNLLTNIQWNEILQKSNKYKCVLGWWDPTLRLQFPAEPESYIWILRDFWERKCKMLEISPGLSDPDCWGETGL